MLALLLLFSFVTVSLGIAYVGATLYFKRKELAWIDGCKRLEAAQKTEAEEAIGSQWKMESEKVEVAPEAYTPEVKHGPVKNPNAIPMPNGDTMMGLSWRQ